MVSRTVRHRQRSKRNKVIAAVLFFVFFGVLPSIYFYVSKEPMESVPVFQKTTGWSPAWFSWQDALFYGIPGFTKTQAASTGVQIKSEVSFEYVLRSLMYFLTNVDIKDLRTAVNSEIAAASYFKSSSPAISASTMPNFPIFYNDSTALVSGKPLVGIYHTHTAESFIPSSGVAHKPGGQIGDIVDVGEALVKHLEKQKIKAIQSKNIHDYPSFMKAYDKSEGTVKTMLAENPSLQMIFDIHRDADARENCVAVVHGITVAKITILVATGQPDLIQPHWQENYAFAKLIDAKLNQRFPGLSKGIQLTEWRYNQQLHPRALLLEVGCQENTKEEAVHSIEMLGDVLADIIVENTH